MKLLKNDTVRKAVALTIAFIIRIARRSIYWRGRLFDVRLNSLHPEFTGRYVYCCWHEYLLGGVTMYPSKNMLALASIHGDGDLIARVMKHLGWQMARGSTSRGASSGLLHMLRDDMRSLTLVPDGPRGPRRQCQQGPIFMASKLQIPLIGVGIGYSRCWRFEKAWDKFAVPKPFSQARAIFGPANLIPPRLTREGIEDFRLWFERHLNWLTDEAEAWATDLRPRPGSLPGKPNKLPPQLEVNPDFDCGLSLPADQQESWDLLIRKHGPRSDRRPGAGTAEE